MSLFPCCHDNQSHYSSTCCCSSRVEIILPEIKSREFEKILKFLYEGEVNVGEEEIGEFFEVARALGVRGLVEEKQEKESILVKALKSNNNNGEGGF